MRARAQRTVHRCTHRYSSATSPSPTQLLRVCSCALRVEPNITPSQQHIRTQAQKEMQEGKKANKAVRCRLAFISSAAVFVSCLPAEVRGESGAWFWFPSMGFYIPAFCYFFLVPQLSSLSDSAAWVAWPRATLLTEGVAMQIQPSVLAGDQLHTEPARKKTSRALE